MMFMEQYFPDLGDSVKLKGIIEYHYKQTSDFFTDKSNTHSYDEIYDIILKPYADKAGHMLEIGVYMGGSLLVWQDYFSKMKITGLDDNPIVPNSILKKYNSDRIDYQIGNAYSKKIFNKLMKKNPNGFDIIIDDGTHILDDQLKFIDLYLKTVRKGGLLVIEDVQSTINISKLIKRIHDVLDPQFGSNYQIHIYDHSGSTTKRYDDVMLVVNIAP